MGLASSVGDAGTPQGLLMSWKSPLTNLIEGLCRSHLKFNLVLSLKVDFPPQRVSNDSQVDSSFRLTGRLNIYTHKWFLKIARDAIFDTIRA